MSLKISEKNNPKCNFFLNIGYNITILKIEFSSEIKKFSALNIFFLKD